MVSVVKMRQYFEVYRFVSTNKNVTKKQILDHLDELGLGMSDSTFERLKNELPTLGPVLDYNKSTKKYSILGSDSDLISDVIEYFQIANTIGYLVKDLGELKKIQEFVQISNSSINGKEHLQQLVDMCINSQEVEFEFKKYENKDSTKTLIQPYMVKELKGRWYIIGIKLDDEKVRFRAYGLDRISDLKKGNYFTRDTSLDAKARYRDVIGMIPNENYQSGKKTEMAKIKLRVDKNSWNWIEALPWHHSQKKVKKDGSFVEFELELKPTPDLVKLILEWTPKVEVIEPIELRKLIVERLKKAVSLNS
jgi:hypothetical protein